MSSLLLRTDRCLQARDGWAAHHSQLLNCTLSSKVCMYWVRKLVRAHSRWLSSCQPSNHVTAAIDGRQLTYSSARSESPPPAAKMPGSNGWETVLHAAYCAWSRKMVLCIQYKYKMRGAYPVTQSAVPFRQLLTNWRIQTVHITMPRVLAAVGLANALL